MEAYLEASPAERSRWMKIDDQTRKEKIRNECAVNNEILSRRAKYAKVKSTEDTRDTRNSLDENYRCECSCYASPIDGTTIKQLKRERIDRKEMMVPNSSGRNRRASSSFVSRMAAFHILLCFLVLDGRPISAAFTTVTTVPEPEFIDPIENITVPAGRNVKFACSVKDLGQYKVAWMFFEKSAILTVQNHVITRNPRVSVTHVKHRTWYLHIKEVQEEDKGKYMCQINTAVAKTQFGFLHVVVPPNIEDSQTSTDTIVRENANVSLTCKASGSPPPEISWKRDDSSAISINKSLSVMEWKGEKLELNRISRLDMGVYLCIASNGVPPTVSKQIKVSVDFPPMLSIPHQLIGAPLSTSVTLECFTEAYPTSLNYWAKDDGPMIHDTVKYNVTTITDKPSYKTNMSLTINSIQESDYGIYKCVAKNPRGETEGTIRLYETPPPSTTASPSTTELPKKDWEAMGEMNNSVYGNPSSLTIHNEKNQNQGSNAESKLSEIGKSEQKSSDPEGKKNYNWQPNSDTSAASRTTTGSLLTVVLTAALIMR